MGQKVGHGSSAEAPGRPVAGSEAGRLECAAVENSRRAAAIQHAHRGRCAARVAAIWLRCSTQRSLDSGRDIFGGLHSEIRAIALLAISSDRRFGAARQQADINIQLHFAAGGE